MTFGANDNNGFECISIEIHIRLLRKKRTGRVGKTIIDRQSSRVKTIGSRLRTEKNKSQPRPVREGATGVRQHCGVTTVLVYAEWFFFVRIVTVCFSTTVTRTTTRMPNDGFVLFFECASRRIA